MKRKELIKFLKEIRDKQTFPNSDDDLENHHMRADHLLLEYINDPEIKECFDDIEKWYS